MDMRDKLRAKTIGRKKEFKKEIVEWDGDQYEVRQPTVAARSKIMGKAGIDIARVAQESDTGSDSWAMMQAWLCIECVYQPGTNDRIFEETDLEALLDQPSGSFVDKFSGVAMGLMNASVEVGKPSKEIEIDSKS